MTTLEAAAVATGKILRLYRTCNFAIRGHFTIGGSRFGPNEIRLLISGVTIRVRLIW